MLAEIDGLREYDASYSVQGIGRFRVNVYRQRGSLRDRDARDPCRRCRRSTSWVRPQACQVLAEKDRGLVLVRGRGG